MRATQLLSLALALLTAVSAPAQERSHYGRPTAFDSRESPEPASGGYVFPEKRRSAVSQAVHETFGGQLQQRINVGMPHWDALGGPRPTTGPTPVMFFAPDRIRQRMKDWGPEELGARFATILDGFIAANPWMKLKHHKGPDALQALYAEVVAGRMQPDEGHIVQPG